MIFYMNPNDPTQGGDQSGMGGGMPTDQSVPTAGDTYTPPAPAAPVEETPVVPSAETPVPGTGDQNPGGESPVGEAPVV